MNVELIAKTAPVILTDDKMKFVSISNSGMVIASAAAKQCYDSGEFNFKEYIQTDENKQFTEKQQNDFMLSWKIAKDSGHTSILEHASATFFISGVSRVLSHQLVRHRLASYTQQSQRYVNMEGASFIAPESIEKCSNPDVMHKYCALMNTIARTYSELCNELIEAGVPKKRAYEDARFVLPNACSTQLIMTMNYRELGDFLGKRMCSRAQWEIRELASRIFAIMSRDNNDSMIFNPDDGVYRGPKCRNQGFCDEKTSCGLMPVRNKPEKKKDSTEAKDTEAKSHSFLKTILKKLWKK